MKEFSKEIFAIFVVIVLFVLFTVGMSFGVPWLSLQVKKTFGTANESVNTDIYRENKSYVEGTVRDLREMRVEYEKATNSHKDALRSLILQRANELDWDRLPSDVKRFLEEF